MAISNDTSAAGAALRNLVERQSWYQEHSNFVTTVIGFLATVAAWAATQPFGSDYRVQILILLVGFLATAAGVSVTPNGFTQSQLRKLNEEQAEIIGSTKLAVPQFEEETPEEDTTGAELEDLVQRYNEDRYGA